MMPWFHSYYWRDTDTPEREVNLIIGTSLPGSSTGDVRLFSDKPAGCARIDRRVLRSTFGRNDTVKLLTALEELDLLVSRLANTYPAQVKVHSGGYGEYEMAHAPCYASPWSYEALVKEAFISLNISNRRMRALLIAAMHGESVAQMAVVDLLLHEKAHQVQGYFAQPDGESNLHDSAFYGIKRRLKNRLAAAVWDNKNLDPFRRVRFEGELLTAKKIVEALPGYDAPYEKPKKEPSA